MKKSIICLCVVFLFACKSPTKPSGKLKVVVTTSMLTDLVKNIGADLIEIEGLMGPGVDPHSIQSK